MTKQSNTVEDVREKGGGKRKEERGIGEKKKGHRQKGKYEMTKKH